MKGSETQEWGRSNGDTGTREEEMGTQGQSKELGDGLEMQGCA